MSKTKELAIECESASIEGLRGGDINVFISNPRNITDILLSMGHDELIEFVARNFSAEDIFSKKELENWAEGEGYIKKTDNDN